MPRAVSAQELFTASEVAQFCQVDLKTIHNWAERGEIRHFRTPGRHLRFRRVDVLDFLRKYGYPIAESLLQGKPRVVVLDGDKAALGDLERDLASRFDVVTYEDPVDALLAVGSDPPDAMIIDENVAGLDGVRIIERLKSIESTRHVRAVLYAPSDRRKRAALDAGASAHVEKPNTAKLRECLEALMGLER